MASPISSAASSGLVLLVLLGALGGCAVQRVPLSGLGVFPPEQEVVELDDVPFHPQTELQCGPAALATVLEEAGHAVTPGALADEVFTPGLGGSLQVELIAAARGRGLVPYVLPPAPEAMFTELVAGRPVLVLQNLRLASWPAWHYAVLVGADAANDTVVLRSGTDRRRVMAAGDFLATWERGGRWALVLLQPGELPVRPDRDQYREAVLGLEETGRHAAAAKAWQAALEAWPEDRVALFGYATNSYMAGDLAAARSGYEALLAASPDDAATLNNLANVVAAQGCIAQARELASRAVSAAEQGSPVETAAQDTLAGIPPGPDGPGCEVRIPGP